MHANMHYALSSEGLVQCSFYSSHFTSSYLILHDFVSLELSGCEATQFAVAATNLNAVGWAYFDGHTGCRPAFNTSRASSLDSSLVAEGCRCVVAYIQCFIVDSGKTNHTEPKSA